MKQFPWIAALQLAKALQQVLQPIKCILHMSGIFVFSAEMTHGTQMGGEVQTSGNFFQMKQHKANSVT